MVRRTDSLRIPVNYAHSDSTFEDINKYPDKCPICNRGCRPSFCYAYSDKNDDHGVYSLQAVFLCPYEDCDKLFLAHYSKNVRVSYDIPYSLEETYRLDFVKIEEFPETINNFSKRFKRIYNQSKIAEKNGLDEICGPGYKKALEFLVKDFLIYHKKEKIENIKNEFLGASIKRIDDKRIQSAAARATWLANDESHYTRKWENKDIEDLKKLIQLTINWIDSVILTEELEKEMPDKKEEKPKEKTKENKP